MTVLQGVPRHLITNANGFPHDAGQSMIAIIVRAIHHAWQVIRADPSGQLEEPAPGNPPEDVYTDAICNILQTMLLDGEEAVPGFTSDVFGTVCRAEHLVNYSGRNINKQPDLVIRLSAPPLIQVSRLVGIFVESKIVSKANPLSKYTDEGIHRFVRGDYAWAMRSGIMLAYQSDKPRVFSELEKCLSTTDHLGTRRSKSVKTGDSKAIPTMTQSSAVASVETPLTPLLTHCADPLMVSTIHDRNWTYAKGDAPGDIELWHVWNLVIP
ncbi:MAG TPA: hypothetical protein VGV14_04615 [Rhodanobacter sp.]|nr:hypothetical protein [Rhodanobacter sp.]